LVSDLERRAEAHVQQVGIEAYPGINTVLSSIIALEIFVANLVGWSGSRDEMRY